jgi:hypothetical protein
MAAPHVVGTLILLAAARPDLDWRGLRDALLGSARRTGLPVETGALDAGAALRAVVPAASWVAPAATPAATTTVKALPLGKSPKPKKTRAAAKPAKRAAKAKGKKTARKATKRARHKSRSKRHR